MPYDESDTERAEYFSPGEIERLMVEVKTVHLRPTRSTDGICGASGWIAKTTTDIVKVTCVACRMIYHRRDRDDDDGEG